MPNNLKNQKLAEDIQKSFSPEEADLALSILAIVEKSGGEPNPEEVRKAAQKVYEERHK